jgi:cytochrome c peroxidase
MKQHVLILSLTSLGFACSNDGKLLDMSGQDDQRPAMPAESTESNATGDPTNADQTADNPESVSGPVGASSYLPVASEEEFADLRAKLIAEKPEVQARQQTLLESRYDLSDQGNYQVTMSRGKPVQEGVRVRLPAGQTWDSLASLSPETIRQQGLFPAGFMPLPHPKQEEGGQVLPQFHIDEIMAQEGRNLKRFDVDMDLPTHFLPPFPPPMYLTSRPDLGDVSRGELITIKNYYELFNGILTPRQLDGLRLLLTPFAQQQFNLTHDRRTDEPMQGISCLDCHANGHTNAATHLDPVTRPQQSRRRLDTPTLRGVNIQRLFGSQRALKTVEDFTEFEQLGAYFDGDHVIAAKKGFNKLDRALQVAHMAEFQSLLDFPPAPKLDTDGKLIPSLATDAELRGQKLFFGKAKCASCHAPPYYTDNTMHDLKTERFYKPQLINGRYAAGDGPIKTFPLRGIRHSPPYLHDGRLLTLADTVEFFNLVLKLGLNNQEKQDLVTFMYAL